MKRIAIVTVIQLVLLVGLVSAQESSAAAGVTGTIKTDSLRPFLTMRDTLRLQSFLHAGDALHIVVYPDTQSFLTGTYRIAADGTIDLPMAGALRVDTLSLNALDKMLASYYLRYLRYPFVKTTPLVRIGFVGGFNKPGFYYVDPEESFWEAFRLSGGPVRQDGLRLLRWERGAKDVSDTLINALQSGKSLRDLGIRSGDRFSVTVKPKRTRIESFNQDVVPVLEVLLTAITTSATLYIVSRSFGGF
jgi:protein involved in polysaccharide export with SLBB domain